MSLILPPMWSMDCLVVKVLKEIISLICFRVYLEVIVFKNPTCFSRWSVRRWDELEEQIPMLRRYYNIKNVLIWDKGNRGSGDLTGAYGNRYECIVYGMKGRRPLNIVDGKQRHDDILLYPKISASKLVHPHQKPLELLEFLIQKSTNEDDYILDMFGGVGSTMCAAINTNRKCISIELDNDVYERGVEYISNMFE